MRSLAASLNVLPVTAPFYRMTERGFGIDAIAREISSWSAGAAARSIASSPPTLSRRQFYRGSAT